MYDDWLTMAKLSYTLCNICDAPDLTVSQQVNNKFEITFYALNGGVSLNPNANLVNFTIENNQYSSVFTLDDDGNVTQVVTSKK